MSTASKGATWLREAVSDNVGLKVVSLTFALGFYAYLHGAQNAQRTFPVSVVVLLPSEAESRQLLTQPPATVRVTLHGGRSSLDELKAEDLGTVQLDVHKGNERYGIFETSQLRLPAGVTPVVEPAGIELAWDSVVTMPVPIQISVTGQPLAGFAVEGQPTAEPRQVMARGPRSIVETMQHARAEPFDVTGLGAGVSPRKVLIDGPPPRVTFDAQSTTVTVQIGRARLDRVYVKIPVQVVGVPNSKSIPAEVDVRVSGPPDVVASLRPDQVVPMADFRAAGVDPKGGGSVTLPITVHIEGCVSQVTPSAVVVKW